MAKDYKNKKGATGKKYTTVGDVIKVTYTDGSTRVVRPSDKTYAATKRDMEKDIGAKKWYKPAGKSKTTAETAVGKGVTDGVVTTAKQKQQNQQYSQTMQKRRAQEAQQKAVTEVAKKEGYNTKPVQKVNTTKKNNNLADALRYGAQTGANNAISGVKTGVLGVSRTVADVVGADNLENDLAHQLRLASAKQQLEQQRINSQYNTNFGGAAKIASDVTAGAVGMLPTIGSFVLTPQGKIAAAGKAAQLGAKAIGFAPLALQAYGGGNNQALNEGATIDHANQYGLGNMAKELGTEVLFGGITHVPGFKNLGDVAANMVKGEVAKKIAGAAGKMAGEGIEEAAAEIADPFIKNATYTEDEEINWGDVAYSGLVGGLTAGALNTGIKGVETGVKVLPTPAKVIQNNQNRAFEALHGQKMMENQAQNVQKPQVKPQQAQDGSASKYLPRPEKPAQNQFMEAEKIRKQMLAEQKQLLSQKRALEQKKAQMEQAERDNLYREIKNLEENIALLRGTQSSAFDDALFNAMDEYTAPEQKQTLPTAQQQGKKELSEAEREKLRQELLQLGGNPSAKNMKRMKSIWTQLDGEQEIVTPDMPMSERTLDNVSNPKVKAYQSTHPEVKAFFREQAEIMLNDLNNMIDARNVTTVRSQTRATSSQIERLLNAGMTKAQIRDGLERIIRDNGAENTANAKKVETTLDDALANGYQSMQGQVPKNLDYVYHNADIGKMKNSYNQLNSEESFANSADPAGLINELEYLNQNITERQQLIDAYSELLPDMSVYETMTAEELHDEMDKLENASQYAPNEIAGEMMARHRYLEVLEEGRVNEFIENEGLKTHVENMEKQLADKKLSFELPRASDEMKNIQKKLQEIEAKQAGISIFNKDATVAKKETVPEGYEMLPRPTSEQSSKADSEPDYEDFDVNQLPKDVVDFYSQVGEVGGKAHFNIRVVQNLEHDAEGKSDAQGNILISAERANDIETVRRVVAHEVYHAMKDTEQWGDIQDMAYELYKLKYPNGTQEQMLQAKIDQYYRLSKGNVQLDTEGAWDEIGAELMGEILSDPKMAERIWNQNPTLAQRIKRWLEDMVAKLYDYVTISEEDSIYKRAFEAYSEGLRNMEYRGQSSETGEARYSIQSDSKGSYVNIDTDQEVFEGVAEDDFAKIAKMYIQDYLSGNQYMLSDGTAVGVNKRGAKKIPYAKDAGDNYATKMRMTPEIENAISIAKERALNVDDGDKHDWVDTWDYYELRFKIGDKEAVAVLNIANTNTGEGRILYDIKIEESGVTVHNNNVAYALPNSSGNILPENQQKSNGKSMYSLPKMPNQKYIGQSDENLRNFMEGSAVVKEDGSPKVVYSGHSNTNLFGSSFDKKRATAGGFYFTANPEIASNYAKDKIGVKEHYENGDEYRIKNEKGQYKLKLQDIHLTDEQIEKFDEWLEEDLGWTYEDFVNERGRYDAGFRNLKYRGGKRYLNNIYWFMEQLGYAETYKYHRDDGEEYYASAFEELMDAMGIEWDSYTKKGGSGGVFPVYLSIKNPIDTSQPFPQDVMKRLERIASRERRMTWDELDEAHWTGNYPVYKWIEDIKRMEETGEETYWATQVPTKARKILQEMGYDGIKDTGGKMGGEEHEVWIAFEPTQVKSAIGNRGTYDATKKDMRYSFDAVGSQEYKDLLDEHGSIPEGEDPTGENYRVEVPRKGLDGKKVREFVRTIMEAPSVDDAVANMFAQELIDPEQMLSGILTMESTGNKALVDAANESINDKGWQQNYKDLHSRMTTGDKITAQDIALATRVAQEAQKAGDAHAAFDILTDLTVVASEFGQGLQAVKILKRLSPEGQLMAFMKTQKRINDSLEKQGKKRVKTMSKETAEEFLKARGNKKRDEIMAKEMARMGQETKGTWTDKLNALRYAAMLSNPKTHLRNIIGNIMMAVVHQPTVAISAAIEDATRLGQKALRPNGVPAEQYRSLVNRSGNSYMELRKYADSVFKDVEPMLRAGGSRYSDSHGGFRQNQRVFGHNPLGNILEQFAGNGKYSVSSALEGEDMLAKRLAFNSALAGYMKANGISVKEAVNGVVKPNGASIERGKEYAQKQAERATFTEENRAADALNRLENTNMASKVLMGGLMPFKNTPMNILTRGFEYSPAGVAMTFYKLKHAATNSADKYERTYNMNDVFESLAANMTGTALMYLGYKMAEAGLLAGAGDDDNERKSRYDQLMGSQEYAFTDPDTGESWTIDWLAPVAMPLFAGAEVFNQVLMRNENAGDPDYDNMIVSALGRIIEPVFEMSCMQGVSDALASYSSGGTEFASSVFKTLVTGYAGQFVPQPLAAAARTMDDTVRSTYTSKESDFPIVGKPGEQFLRQQKNKIPVKSQENEPSIDVWGEERKREFAGDGKEQFVKRALNNFFNPTTYSSDKRTELDKELEKLYSDTGESTVLPKAAESSFEYQGKTYYMTPQEKTAYDRTKGQKSRQYVSGFVNSNAYDSMDDDTKADIIADLYDLANYEAKKQMLDKRGITYTNDTNEKVLESGVNPGDYYGTRKALYNVFDYDTSVQVLGELKELGLSTEKFAEASKMAATTYADKNAKGNPISGSKKKKVVANCLDMGLTQAQAKYVYDMQDESRININKWNNVEV